MGSWFLGGFWSQTIRLNCHIRWKWEFLGQSLVDFFETSNIPFSSRYKRQKVQCQSKQKNLTSNRTFNYLQSYHRVEDDDDAWKIIENSKKTFNWQTEPEKNSINRRWWCGGNCSRHLLGTFSFCCTLYVTYHNYTSFFRIIVQCVRNAFPSWSSPSWPTLNCSSHACTHHLFCKHVLQL